jgi:hypothetical protein
MGGGVNYKFERIQKETVLASLRGTIWNLPRGTEIKYEKLHTG